jgi:hypothetical protein
MDDVLKKYRIAPRQVIEALGVSKETVRMWRLRKDASARPTRSTRRPSAENAIALEAKLGIPRWETRPDLWPPPAAASAKPRRAAAKRRPNQSVAGDTDGCIIG